MIRQIYATASAITDASNRNSVVALTEKVVKGNDLLACFGGVPADVAFKEILSAYACVYLSDYEETNVGLLQRLNFDYLEATFDPTTVTYNSKPSSVDISGLLLYAENDNTYYRQYIMPGHARHCLDYGIAVCTFAACIHTTKSSNKPYMEIEYSEEDTGVTCEQTYPVGSATISRVLPTTFSWKNSIETYNTLVPVELASTKLRWRYSGASSYTEIDAGTDTSYTVPANTFKSGTVEWQIVTTANSRAVRTTPWTAVSVEEPVPSTTLNYPKNTVLDGTKETTFSWNHIIANGTKQTAYDLQTSPNGTTWTTLRSVTTADTSVTIPANTLVAGDLYWRVRTYNLDAIAGEWSDVAHVVVVAAPNAPGVTVDAAEPKFRLRWQQTGQQAYEILLDGTLIAKQFTEEAAYQYTDYLAPGTYLIQVRIQNKYGLWSEYGELVLTISNTSGPEIYLEASGDNDVNLRWSAAAEYSGYIVYRNGEKVGETTDTAFTDYFALGAVSYQVRGVYADSGNYTLSNTVDLTIEVPDMIIADVEDPKWLSLAKSTSSLRSTSLSASHAVSYSHYVGKALPRAEIGEAVDKFYQIDCAWPINDMESAAAFEALAGKIVCVKTPSGRRIIGVMGNWTATENRFWVSYKAPITLIDWDDALQSKKKQSSEPEIWTVDIDALIEDSITEITSSAKRVKDYVFSYSETLKSAYFPNALLVEMTAFGACKVLETALFPSAIEVHPYAFQNCKALKTVSFPKATSIGMRAFNGCQSLTEIALPSAVEIGSYAFDGCTALSKVDLGKVTTIYARAFRYCEALEALIIRTGGFCELDDANAFDWTPIQDGTGYIYVPSAQVAAYKADAVWSTYAAQIRAIEDYPEITGG